MNDSRSDNNTRTKERSRAPSVEDTETQPAPLQSPVYFLGIVAISIIGVEAVVMIFLSQLQYPSLLTTVLIDSTLLIVLLAPVLYLFLYRPQIQYINRHRRIEEALITSEEKCRTLVNISPVGIYNIDAGGVLTYINKEGCRIADLTPEEAYAGEDVWVKSMHPEDRERVLSEWRQALSGHMDFISEYRFQRKDGKSAWVIGHATALKDSAGQFIGYTGTLTDITDRKEDEERLQWEASVNALLSDLSRRLLSEESKSIDEISCQVLEHARQLTGSEFGYVGYIDPDTGFLISPTLTRDIWEQCNVPQKTITFEKFSGLWGWVLNNKKSLMTNTPGDDPRSSGVPEGHLPIHRFLSVPALAGEKLVGQISLANPDRDYTINDLKLLEQMAGLYAIAVQNMRAEEAIRESEEKLRTITYSSSDAIVMIDNEATISFWNDSAERMFGYERHEALGKDMHELIVPQRYHEAMKKGLEKFAETGEGEALGKVLVLPAVRKGGEEFFAEHSLAGVRLKDKWHSIGIIRDVTERIRADKELITSEEKYKDLADSLDEVIYRADPDSFQATYVNSAIKNVYGYSEEEWLKDPTLWEKTLYPEDREKVFSLCETARKEIKRGLMTYRIIRKDQEIRWVEDRFNWQLDEQGKAVSMNGVLHDITGRIQAEKELLDAATREGLTGLLNRFSFEKDEKTMEYPVLVLIDIDGFRHVNDLYGVAAGNSVLRDLSRYLESIPPEMLNAKVYKLGGDDFGILFEDTPDYNPMDLAKRIVEEGSSIDFMYEGNAISISFSAGISRERPLLEKADMVLNYLRRHTRVKYLEYNETLNIVKDISQNMKMLSILKRAINKDAIVSYFQPIVNNKTGRIEKYECLVRIIEEGGKVLSPFAFLQVAKEARLYGAITRKMIERGMAAFKDTDYEFSINISVEDIHDREVEEFMSKMLENNPEIARRTTFEIIESEGIENYETVYAFIQKVKGYGCKIAIDDFGAGYSNFGHTMQLDIDYIKIDASMIKEIDRNEKLQILTETIVNYAQRLGIKTIAEYVHSKEVHEKVIELGVDYSQGYYLGEPKPTIE